MKIGLFRSVAIGLGVLLWGTLAAAWLVPPLLDWSRYRADIAALVSEDLGRDVRIGGKISLSLLPQPILTAGGVSLTDTQDGVSISVNELRVRLALAPLLSGRVDAQELVLRGLDLRLPWPLGTGTLALQPPSWLSSISARVEDGHLAIGSVAANHINATLGLTPETGSYGIAGTTEIYGQPWQLTARLTRIGNDGTAGLDLSLDGQGKAQGLGAMFTGQIAADGALHGRISGGGPDLSRLLAAPKVPFKADGLVNFADGLARADALAVEIAGSPARAAVSLRIAPALRLDVALAASRLDLDAWLPALLRDAGGRIVPAIPTGIDLTAEAATLAGGTLRSLRGRFDITQDNVALQDVSAILPGDAQFALAGQMGRSAGTGANATLHFDGHASLAAPSLRTTLGWLDGAGLAPLATLPTGVWHSADLRAAVTADSGAPPQIVLSDLNGLIDQSHVQGSLTLRPADRFAVAGVLSLDRVVLEPWLPDAFPALVGLPSRLGKFDLDLQLHADQARLGGETLSPASLDAQLEAGKLTLRRLDVQTPGARLVLSGSVNDAGKIADGKLDVSTATDNAGPVLSTWWPQLAPLAAHIPHGALALSLQASGPPEALGLRGVLDLGDLHVEAQPVLDLPGGKWTAALSLRHPGAPRLLDSIGLGNTAAWLGDGSLSWAGTLSGAGPIWAPSRIGSDGFDLAAGNLRAKGALTLDRSGATPKLTGRINAETLPLPLPYPRAPDPLPTEMLAGWQASVKLEAGQILAGLSPVLRQASTMVSLDNGVLHLNGLAAKLEGGALTGSATLDTSAAPPTLAADLALAGASLPGSVFDLPLDLSGGVIDANATLAASGYSPGALLATLSGTLHLQVRDGTLLGVDLARAGPRLADADLRAALAGGATAFERFDIAANLRNGAALLDAANFTGPAGTGSLSGLLDIAGRTAELRLALLPAVTDPPEVAVRLSGPMFSPTRTPEITRAMPWRTEHPAEVVPTAAPAPPSAPVPAHP